MFIRKLCLRGINLSTDIANNVFSEETKEKITSKSTQLERVHINDKNISDRLLIVAKALQNISSLKMLDLTDIKLPNEICHELALAIQSNHSLEELHLGNNNLRHSFDILLQPLSKLSSLKVLSIENTEISDDCFNVLATACNRK